MSMENWPVFLTAANTAPKALNKALLLLQDFALAYALEPPNPVSNWVLLTLSDLSKVSPKPVAPPLVEPINGSDFANKTPADINSFVRANEARLKELGMSTGNLVIIDQEGLDNGTCIVAHQLYTDAAEGTNTSKAVRVPFHVAADLVGNLDLGNMGFEEWADEDAGVQADGLYKWVGPFPMASAPDALKEQQRKIEANREAALKALRDLGYVD